MATPDKDFEEELPIRFDFTAALDGEEINDYVVTCEVAAGGDSQPTGFLKDAALKVGTKIDQWIRGGVTNTKYRVRCKVTTSSGRVLVGSAQIRVIKR